MTGKSKIEWTEQTWNPVVGCSIKSPGCAKCYAMPMAARIEAINAALVAEGKPPQSPQYDGTTKKVNGNAVWTGKLATAGDNILLAPLRREKPTIYFVNSMGDLFHEDCPDEWIDRVFAVMALCPQHTFQVLTKRAARMRNYITDPDDGRGHLNTMHRVWDAAIALDCKTHLSDEQAKWLDPDRLDPPWPLPNVWLGVSTERQQEADARIPELLATPAAVRFISAEPLLGEIDLTTLRPEGRSGWIDSLSHREHCGPSTFVDEARPHLDWIIVGGESGPDARPMHSAWARSLRDQCAAAGVAFFFKQWGEYGRVGDQSGVDHLPEDADVVTRVGKKRAGRLLDGVEHNGMPEVRG